MLSDSCCPYMNHYSVYHTIPTQNSYLCGPLSSLATAMGKPLCPKDTATCHCIGILESYQGFKARLSTNWATPALQLLLFL